MRFVLDTHAFLWWIRADPRLSPPASRAIAEGVEIRVSVVSIWEIAIKARLGRLHVEEDFGEYFRNQIAANRFRVLPVELAHTSAVHGLIDHPGHRDPFDRLLAAQSLVEELPLISRDRVFDDYGVERLW